MRTSANGLIICKFKNLTMDFVESLGYTTPAYRLARTASEAEDMLVGDAVVVKPIDGHRSEGVSVNIIDVPGLQAAITFAQAHSARKEVIVQRMLTGKLYRLLVVDGKLVAVMQRKAAEVVGDGRTTLRGLVERTNADPRRGDSVDTPLKKIHLEDVKEYLGAETLNTVPTSDQTVRVTALDSVSAGGEAINATDFVHDDWRKVTEHIAHEAGLFIAGYDVICDDIANPLMGKFVPLLEINSSPGLKLHEYPTGGGEPIHIAPLLLDALFPMRS